MRGTARAEDAQGTPTQSYIYHQVYQYMKRSVDLLRVVAAAETGVQLLLLSFLLTSLELSDTQVCEP